MRYFASMNRLFLALCFCGVVAVAQAQSSFIDYQRTNPKAALAFRLKEDTLKKQFAAAGLQWPARQVYFRSFKYDSQLEVWVRNSNKESYKLFKTYKVCALSGALGPKRIEGDYQVPEGFYCINHFNPRSNYHLALGLNYPNFSDLLLSDSLRPGNNIYIHGGCVTVGCIPMEDNQIEELYVLAAYAANNNEDYIPVHIFPVRYNREKSAAYLAKITKEDADYLHFSNKLKEVYDYFELHKKLPVISINSKGEYVIL
jgi:murein L,D-transpeptidase YafK